MFDYSALYQSLREQGLDAFATALQVKVDHYFETLKHGDVAKWQEALENLPAIRAQDINFSLDAASIGLTQKIEEEQKQCLIKALKGLMPWRKGPFKLFDVFIDSEWQCQLKWQRLARHIDLGGKRVLDVGCGNGYYMLRMLGAGAKQVVGIDPMLRFVFQFEALKKYFKHLLPIEAAHILPLTMQDLPAVHVAVDMHFDTTFSMGVLYHRRDPLDHLMHLKSTLHATGELWLETLVIDEGTEWGELLEPALDKSRDKRYAKMNNVWNIPTVPLLQRWVRDAGFASSQVCDISTTNFEEQRSTEWMTFHSLEDFTHPENKSLTVEGYPGPKRVLLHCKL